MNRLRVVLFFYRRRLRVHAIQEAFAGFGIAAGVALVFSVQIANSSMTGSAKEILRGITGEATLQLAARSPDGFQEDTLARVRAMDGVARASAVLEQRATVTYEGRRVGIDVVGVDPSLPSLGGTAVRYFNLGGLVLQRGILLPSAVGDALLLPTPRAGYRPPVVTLGVRGRAQAVDVTAVLDHGLMGSLADALLGVASLRYAQELTGLDDRVTRVLVVAKPGAEAQARRELEEIAAGRLTVAPVEQERRLLEQAAGPIDQSTGLFAAIGVMFGFTAMLLTIPDRRRFVAELRIMGYRPGRVIEILGFQALMLGVVASLMGLLAGWVLSRTATHDPPGYLAFAFPLGIQRVVTLQAAVLPFVAGMLATFLAAAQPLADLWPGRAVNAVMKARGEPGHTISARTRQRLALAAVALTVAVTVAIAIVPELTMVGVALIAVAVVLAVPAAFAGLLRLADIPARRWHLNSLAFAIRSVRATSLRAPALVATSAVVVFGSVAIKGAHENLLNGLYGAYAEYAGTADVWIAQPDDDLAFHPFVDHGLTRELRTMPGVASVRSYQGGLFDFADRRVWVIARPQEDDTMVPASQIIEGSHAEADRRLRAGGWVTLSQQIADALGAAPGDRIELPTPTGDAAYRVAATTTNLGWGPGAVVIGQPDYRDAWGTAHPSAIEVTIASGARPVEVRRAIERAIGSATGLQVQTTRERSEHANGIAREGLARLGQISALLLIAAALAMAAAMGAAIYQRRRLVAQMRIMGWKPPKLWRALLLETALVLGVGCLVGAVAGLYGHYLGNRWLEISTGYPAPFAFSARQTIGLCALLAFTALAVTAIPGWFVSRTPPRVGLRAS